MQDFAFKPAHEIADAVRRRAVSPVETVEAALAAMAATEPRLHAFATPAPEQALADARALEQSLARGGAAGLLAGVPVAIKDLLFTKGLRTTFGSRLYADFVPDDDDIVVERLKAAGAIVIGKTNVAEFGYSAVGHNPLLPTTCNPWNLAVTPGGSSAGSAAAVAAGVCPLAVGSDGGGSVRLPAGFTGLFGIKASMGRVPVWPGCRDPAWPGASGWESIEHIGPMARSVADAALMLQVMAGPDARDRWSLPADGTDWRDVARPVDRLGLRIAYCPQWEDVAVDPEVRALVDAAVAVFETLGCSVETLDAPVRGLVAARRAIISLESDIAGMRKLAAGREAELSGPVRGLLSTNWQWGQFTDALTERKRCGRGDAPLHGTLRSPADADGAAAALCHRSRRARHDRRAAGRGRLLDARHVSLQSDGPARRKRSGWLVGGRIAGRFADRRPASRRCDGPEGSRRFRAGPSVGTETAAGHGLATPIMRSSQRPAGESIGDDKGRDPAAAPLH